MIPRVMRLAGGLVLSLGILTAAPGAGYAAESLGMRGARFLEMPVGARGIAMGTAQGAAADDATALYYNPAGLAGVKGGSLTLMHALYFEDVFYQYGAVSQNLGDMGTVAFGVQYLEQKPIFVVDNTGKSTGDSIKPSDLAATLGYARSLGVIDLGVGVKYISSKILTQTATMGMDLGSRLRLGALTLAVSVTNLGYGIKLGTQKYPLPLTARFGSSVKMGPWVLALDLVSHHRTRQNLRQTIAGGVERFFRFSRSISVAARGGYDGRVEHLGSASGLRVGLGLSYQKFQLDYALVPFGDLGQTHRLSVSARWGAGPGDFAAESGPRWSTKDKVEKAPQAVPEEDPEETFVIYEPAFVAPKSRRTRPAPKKKRPAPAKRRKAPSMIEDEGMALTIDEHFVFVDRLIKRRALEKAKRRLGAVEKLLGTKDLRRVRYWERMGRVAYLQKNIAQAKNFYLGAMNSAISLGLGVKGSRVAEAYAGMGLCLVAEGNLAEAAGYFAKGLEANPSKRIRRLMEAQLRRITGE